MKKKKTCSICCDMCHKLHDMYMVKDKVWKEAKQSKDTMLCLTCFEKVLGRDLTIMDFKRVPCNHFIWFGYFLAKKENSI